MSNAEILALVIAAALGGIGTGLGIAILVLLRRAHKNVPSHEAIEAYANWLAARKRFARAAMTFVSTFRALSNSKSQPQSLAARRSEANQARAGWREAAGQLDTAEAGLIAWAQDQSTMRTLEEHPRVCGTGIRSAIDATDREAEEFFDKIELRDRIAAEALRPGKHQAGATSPSSGLAIRFAKGVYDCLDELSDRWSRR